MPDRFLGIDLGTSAVKVLLVDDDGNVRGRGEAEHPMLHPRPGHAEQRPDDWWTATVTAVQQAVAAGGESAPVCAIGLTGQMHGTVLLDERDTALAPAIIWADTRAGAEVAEITHRIGARRLIELAGSPVAVGFQAATIRWLQTTDRELWRQVRRVLLPKDYLRWRLTGAFATDPSDASGALLLDVQTRDWSPDILAALDIDINLLPPVQPSASVAGQLQPGSATALGLPAGLPIVTGGGDAPCGALGAGVVDSTSMLLTISTGAQSLVPAHDPAVDVAGRIHTFCGAIEPAANQPGWYQMGATMVAGLALRWLRDEVFGLPSDSGYDPMIAAANAVPPGAGGLLFLPYLAGERTPHMNPNARGMFLGLTAAHGRGHLVRAVMEGVTFALLDAFDVIQAIRARPDRAILAGGGARSLLWQQIVADVFGLTLVPLETEEQSALGAAMLARATVDGHELMTTARSWARYGAPVTPRPQVCERYIELLRVFRAAYVKHLDDFEMLTAIDSTLEVGQDD